MKEIIYLVVDQRGVQNMRKALPEVRRGEIPVKLTINVPPEAFSPPTLARDHGQRLAAGHRTQRRGVQARHHHTGGGGGDPAAPPREDALDLGGAGFTVTEPEPA